MPEAKILMTLLGVQLHDQAFVDVGRQLSPVRVSLENAFHLVGVDLNPR
jgi:hypothetical protein